MIIPTVKVKRDGVIALVNEDDYDSSIHELVTDKPAKKAAPAIPDIVEEPAKVEEQPAPVKRTTSRKKKKAD